MLGDLSSAFQMAKCLFIIFSGSHTKPTSSLMVSILTSYI